MKLQLEIDVKGGTSGRALKVVEGGVRDIGKAARDANSEVSALGKGIQSMIGNLLSGFTALQGFRFLKGLVQEGVLFNATMETSRLGIAALIQTFTVFKIAGKEVTDETTKQTMAMQLAVQVQDKLRLAALQTTATYEELIDALGEGLGPALQAGFNLDQVVEFTKAITQTAAAIRLPMNQLGQEIRAIFEGDTQRYSRISRQIIFPEIPKGDVQKTIRDLEKQGKLYDFVMGRMRAFIMMGRELEGTFYGVWSNFKDAVQQALGSGTQDATKELTTLFIQLRSEIVQIDAAGHATFNPEFVDRVKSLAGAFVTLAKALADVAKFFALEKGPTAFGADAARSLGLEGVGVRIWNQRKEEDKKAGIDSIPERITRSPFSTKPKGRMFSYLFSGKDTKPWTDKDGTPLMEPLERRRNVGPSMADFLKGMQQLEIEARKNAAIEAEMEKQRLKEERALQRAAIAAERYANALQNIAEQAQAANLRSTFDSVVALVDAMNQKSYGADRIVGEGLKDEVNAVRDLYNSMLAADKLQRDLEEKISMADLRKTDRDVEGEKKAADEILQIRTAALNEYRQKYSAIQSEVQRKLVDHGGELTKEVNEKTLDNVKRQFLEVEAEWFRLRDLISDQRGLFANLANDLKDSLRDVFSSLFDGEGNPFQGLFENFKRTWTEFLGGVADEYLSMLGNIAAGRPYKKDPKTGGDVYMGADGQQKALYGMAALQGGMALYGAYQNRGSRSQNMMSLAASGGAIGGMMAGATAGGISGPVGMIIGAAIGALVGAFLPTKNGKNVKIGGNMGSPYITGLGERGDWSEEKVRRSIGGSMDEYSAAMDDVMELIPLKIWKKILAKRPDPSKTLLEGKGDGENWTEELDNFLKFTVPQKVISSYFPMLEEALTLGGVEMGRVKELEARAAQMEPGKAVELFKKYINAMFGMQDALEFLNLTPDAKMKRAVGEVNKSPIDQMNDFNSDISRLAGGFGDLPLEQQIDQAHQIMDLVASRYEMEIQYLNKLNDLSLQLNESTRSLVDEIAMDQMRTGYDEQGKPIYDTKKQVDFLQGRQRTLWGQISNAKTPEELERYMSEYQNNAMAIYRMLGQTPEAAKMVTSQLEDANKVAQARIKTMQDAVEASDKILRDTLQAILDFLQKVSGLPEPGGGTGGGGGEGGGGGNVPGLPLNPVATDPTVIATIANVGAFGVSVTSTVPAIDAFGGALMTWAGKIAEATIVATAPPVVNVHINGSMAAVVDSVEVEVGNKVEKRVMDTVLRRTARGVFS